MEDRLLDILKVGFHAHQTGDLDTAATHYRDVLTRDPGNADASHLLGLVMMQKGDPAAAAELIHQSLETDPDNPQALDHLGLLLTDLNNLKEAIAAFEDALDKAPDFTACWLNLGAAKELARDFSGAVAAFEQAAAIEPDYAYTRLGIAHGKRGAHVDALESFEKALAIDPTINRALRGRADALQKLRRTQEAISAYEDCLSYDSRNGTIQSMIGACYSDAERYDEALENYDTALSLNPSNLDTVLGAGICRMRQGDYDAALESLRKASSLKPGHPRVLAYEALLYNLLDRPEEARELVDFERDIVRRCLPVPPGYENRRQFDAALASALRRNPTLRRDPSEKSTRGGLQSGLLNLLADDVMTAFNDTLDRFVADYLAGLTPVAGHPHFNAIPDSYRIESWATILDAGGYQLPHIHPDAWVSGVYYVAVPDEIDPGDESHAGWIEFGAPGYGLPGKESTVQAITPHEGEVVLFPSYFFHRTLPFQAESQRISIAFDVIDTSVYTPPP